jgi:thiol-disulfide isomerase/thioredoxin
MSRLLAALALLLVAAVARAAEPTFAELQGDVTVVAFWATWCPPCVAELPSLAALQTHIDGQTRVVAISVQDGAGAAQARQLFADRKLTVPLLTDGKPLYARLFPRAGEHVTVPRLAVLDKSGRGFEAEGFAPDQSPDDFVRELQGVIARVRDGSRRPPNGWHRLRR